MMRSLLLLGVACCVAIAQTAPPSVSGVALDSKGQPIRKVRLTLRSTNGDAAAPYGATAGADGKFEFYSIPQGRYRLVGEHAGYLRSTVGAKNTWAVGTTLTVQDGKPISGLAIRMREQAVISGKVTVEGITSNVAIVSLIQQRYVDGRLQPTVVATSTTESGEFRFNKLASGRYYLFAKMPPPSDIGAFYYPGVTDFSAAAAIPISSGQEYSDLNFALKKGALARVRGAVTTKGQDPATIRVLMFLNAARQTRQSVASNVGVAKDGTFEFPPTPAGSYTLVAIDGRGPQPVFVSVPIELIGQDIGGITLRLDSVAVLPGLMKFEGFAAPPRVSVNLGVDFAVPRPLTVSIQSEGPFSLANTPPGRYAVSVQNLPVGAYVKSIFYGEKDAMTQDLDLTAGISDTPLRIVVSQAGAQIGGVVQSDSVVTLVPEPPQPRVPSLYQSVETDANGRFLFRGIRPGKYRIFAWEELEPGTHFDPAVTEPLKDRSVLVEVAEGDRKNIAVSWILVDQ